MYLFQPRGSLGDWCSLGIEFSRKTMMKTSYPWLLKSFKSGFPFPPLPSQPTFLPILSYLSLVAHFPLIPVNTLHQNQRSISEITISSLLVLPIEDLLQLVEQFIEGLSDVVGSSRMVRAEVIGRLPLSDHIISGGVVSSSVMVEDSPLNQEITELDTSGKSTQVFNLHVVLLEEVQQLVGLIVHDRQDLLSSYPWVVGPVRDGSGVVVAIESSEHDT